MLRPRPPRRTKLTEAQARRIRAALAKGARCLLLAKRFKVAPATILAIARGDLWAHLGPPPRPCQEASYGSVKYGPEFAAEVLALRAQGLSFKEISRKLGMPVSGHQTVRRIVNGTHWTARAYAPACGPDFAAKVLDLHRQGKSLRAMMRRLGKTDHKVIQAIVRGTHWSVREHPPAVIARQRRS